MRLELDHVVLEVPNVERSAAFYRDVLGLRPVRLAEFRAGRAPFVSARIGAGCVLDFFPRPMWRGMACANPHHVCLATSRRGFAAVARRLAGKRVRITRRDDRNFGARGFGRSLYFDDPDGNTIEIRHYAELS